MVFILDKQFLPHLKRIFSRIFHLCKLLSPCMYIKRYHKCSGLLHATTFVEYTHYISIYMWIVDGKSEKYGEKIALVVHIGIEALYKVMERKQKKKTNSEAKREHKLILENIFTVFFDISSVSSIHLHCASIQNGRD